ncbi:MAG: right-handed parallel beta-helix repeat-containing protein [Planctomycetota bacterium]|jgi:hypothetical protein
MRWKLAVFSIGAAVLVCASVVSGDDRLVPGVYPTIEAGIEAALPGDTVVIAPGLYTGPGNRDLDFGGKAVTVRSTEPNDPNVVAATVIDCEYSGRGFYFHTGETSAAVVTGLTIINGNASYGGAVYCDGSSPTISKCTFSGNNAALEGGAIQNDYCSPTVAGCTFASNSGSWSGGAMSNFFATPTVKSCIFSGNSGDCGGAIINHESDAAITNCTFSGNSAFQGGAIHNSLSSGAQVYNCILWGDSAGGSDPEIYGDCVVSYSDVQAGWAGTGNIDADPCFVNPVGDDYHLSAGSPCIDAGDPVYSPAPGDTDIDGEARVMGIRVDMGADEFTAAPTPIIEVLPASLEFSGGLGGPNPASQVLSIRNAGSGALHWQITEDCTWLEVSPASGESAGETNEVNVSVDIAGLPGGQYDCELTVSDPNASNDPQIVDVSLVISGPIIELSPQAFDFTAGLGGPDPLPQTLTIRNSGAAVLNWQISEDCPWLSAEPNSGGLAAGQAVPAALFVDISGLEAGGYYCQLTVSDPNAENNPQTVAVSLVISGPIIEVSSELFEFSAPLGGPDPLPQTLTIRNSGAAVLHWQLNEDCPWLSTDPSSGSLAASQAVPVALFVDISGLTGGTYNCQLIISDPNAENTPQVVDVTLFLGVRMLHVPSEYSTIQAAIDAAMPSDTVIVADGIYTGPGNRDIDFKGKAITVRSENGPFNCTIDCGGSSTEPHRGFRFHSGEGSTAVVSGFTITNGYGPDEAAVWSDPAGGAIYCQDSDPTISRCIITGNSSGCCGAGAGIACVRSSLTIRDCIISGNGPARYGGGVWFRESGPMISHCTVTGNTAAGGIWCHHLTTATISHCILWGNIGSEIVAQQISWPSHVVVTYSDVEGGQADVTIGTGCTVEWGLGNVDTDPCFVNAAGGDFHLSPLSLCIDAGDPAYSPAPGETDIDGEPRIMGGPIDMGADEFTAALIPIIALWPRQFEFWLTEGGPNPADQIVSISNIGVGTLNWQITEDCPWVWAEPNSGSLAPGEAVPVALFFDVPALAAGSHNCQLTVSDPDAENSPQISISLHVVEGCAPVGLSYEAETYAYAGAYAGGEAGDSDTAQDSSTNSRAECVANASDTYGEWCGPMNNYDYQGQESHTRAGAEGACDSTGAMLVSALEGWGLRDWRNDCTGSSGEAPGGGWGSGHCSLVGVITSGGSVLKVDAEIIGDVPGAWDSWDWWFKMWDDDANNPVAVLNDGNTVVILDVSPGQLFNVELYHEAGHGWWPAAGLDSTVAIDFSTTPVMEISPTEFYFEAELGGDNPEGQVWSISNPGVGTLNWEIAHQCDWVSAEPSSGSTTGEANEVLVSADISGLAPGWHYCELTVSAEAAGGSPQTVGVTLYVSSGYILVPSQFETIQAGIDAAMPGDTVMIAPGTYTGTGNKNLDFGGKAITVQSTDPEDPCVVAATVIDCESSGRGFYFHSGEDANSVIAGLTIRRGTQWGAPARGGGILCEGSSPTIRSCILENNWAHGSTTEDGYGGGICCLANSHPVIVGCTVSANTAKGGACEVTTLYDIPGGAGFGGGIYCSSDSTVTIDDCIVRGNRARTGYCYGGYFEGTAYGGGIYGRVTVSNSTIEDNRLVQDGSAYESPSGGGLYCRGGSVLANCLIINNEIDGTPWGSAIYCGGTVTIRNCTISNNEAGEFGRAVDDSYYGMPGGTNTTITNSVLWNNGGGYDVVDGMSVTYSCTEQNISGEGNIHTDPRFVDANGDDYHLLEASPCINAGDPAYSPAPGETDIDGEPRIMGGPIDMGADEFTAAFVPMIELSPRELDFSANEAGPNPPPQVLSIRNLGSGVLEWEIAESCSWLQAIPASGQSSGEANEVALNVDVSGLSPGQHTCQLVVSDPNAWNSPQVVDINLLITGPLIHVSQTELVFRALLDGPNPVDQIFNISNIGGGRLYWSITYDCNWLSVEPNTGSTTLEADHVTLSVDAAGLDGGIYNCELVILDANSQNYSVTVGVILLVGRGLYVPSAYGRIQAAIDEAQPGDTVVIAPGTYTGDGNRDLDFGGKAIMVRSTDPADPCVVAATVINCEGTYGDPHRGFTFQSGEGPISVLAGVTICKAYIGFGAGIMLRGNSSPTISHCVISDNVAGEGNGRGGGIDCHSSSPRIRHCVIRDNSSGYMSEDRGGGMWFHISNALIENCLIIGNSSQHGGGIWFDSSCNLTIRHCTISGNHAYGSGGGLCGGDSSTRISECLVWDNTAASEPQIYGSPILSYSNVQDGYAGTGNICADPCFVAGPFGNYYLSQLAAGQAVDSLCVDAGSDAAANLGMDLYTTRTDEVGDTGIIDMGYHYPIPAGPGAADVDGDWDVDLEDYTWFALGWYYGTPNQIPMGAVAVDGNLDDWPEDVQWRELDKVYDPDPNDVVEASFALQWDPNTNKVYAAVIVDDSDHVFLDEYVHWDASDRIEVYSQGDAQGGSGWYGVYDAAQHYMVGPNTSGGAWATWALGQELGEDVGLEYAVVVNGDEIVYEVGVRQFDNYGGFSGGATVPTELDAGDVVRFDVIVDTRWSSGFGMLAENLMAGKYTNADQFARYVLVEKIGRGDLDGNGIIDARDLDLLAKGWLWGK